MTEKANKTTKTIHYVQFSKRMVVFISLAVTACALIGMALCFFGGHLDGVVSIVNVYTWYGVIAFVAYSGNSMLEKWLVNRFAGSPVAFATAEGQVSTDTKTTKESG